MFKSLLIAVPLLVSSVIAAPSWGPWGNPQQPCLSDDTAQSLIKGYTYLLEYPTGSQFDQIANQILSDKFFVSSDSINTLAGYPLGVPAYPSKQAFIAGQAKTPALPGLETLGYFYNCNKIAWRWNVTEFGTRQYEIKGIITMDVNATSSQIDAVYSEFNTVAFQKDIPKQ